MDRKDHVSTGDRFRQWVEIFAWWHKTKQIRTWTVLGYLALAGSALLLARVDVGDARVWSAIALGAAFATGRSWGLHCRHSCCCDDPDALPAPITIPDGLVLARPDEIRRDA